MSEVPLYVRRRACPSRGWPIRKNLPTGRVRDIYSFREEAPNASSGGSRMMVGASERLAFTTHLRLCAVKAKSPFLGIQPV